MSNGFEKFTGTHTLTSAEYWGHIQEKNMSTNYHNHGSEGVSGVYYCQMPENSAEIVFWWKESRRQATPRRWAFKEIIIILYETVLPIENPQSFVCE